MTSNTTEDESTATSWRRRWSSRIPARVLGRFRTTTVVMVIAFLLVLLLWNSVRFDPTMDENSPVYVPPAPTTSESVPEQTFQQPYTTSVPTTTTPTTTPSSTVTTTPGGAASDGGTLQTTPSTTTTTGVPGLRLPTIPGLPLPTGAN